MFEIIITHEHENEASVLVPSNLLSLLAWCEHDSIYYYYYSHCNGSVPVYHKKINQGNLTELVITLIND